MRTAPAPRWRSWSGASPSADGGRNRSPVRRVPGGMRRLLLVLALLVLAMGVPTAPGSAATGAWTYRLVLLPSGDRAPLALAGQPVTLAVVGSFVNARF